MGADLRPPFPPPLGRTIGRGMSWTGGGAVVSRLAVLAGQLALGALLSKGDFGIYAIAIGWANLITSMQDGGMRELLVQRGSEGYARVRGAAFWMAVSVNGTLALVLLIAARPLAAFYDEPEVAPLLAVLALSVVLNTPFRVLMAKLQADLRFGPFASMTTFDAVARTLGAVLFALAGFGPLSFVLAIPLVNIIEWLLLRHLTGERLATYRPDVGLWAELAPAVRWLAVGGLAFGVLKVGDYAVLGLLVPTAVLGVYFFAWQLITQSATLISGSLMAVLLPALARMRHEPARRRRVTQRAVRGLVITAAPVCLAAAVTFAPAEELLWDEKWRAAVVPFILLAVAFPFRLTVPISRASLMAGGRFRAHATLLAVNGLGLMLCAAFAGSATDDVNLITAAVAGYLVLASLISLAYATHELDLGWADLLRAVTPAWALCVALALPLIALDRLALDGQPPLLRIVGLGLTFVLAVGIAYRHFLAADLTDILAVVPPPVARRARRVLFLSRS